MNVAKPTTAAHPSTMLLTTNTAKTGATNPLTATMLVSKAIRHFTTLLSFTVPNLSEDRALAPLSLRPLKLSLRPS